MASELAFCCGNCGKKMRVPINFAGRRGMCPKCEAQFTIPTLEMIEAELPNRLAVPPDNVPESAAEPQPSGRDEHTHAMQRRDVIESSGSLEAFDPSDALNYSHQESGVHGGAAEPAGAEPQPVDDPFAFDYFAEPASDMTGVGELGAADLGAAMGVEDVEAEELEQITSTADVDMGGLDDDFGGVMTSEPVEAAPAAEVVEAAPLEEVVSAEPLEADDALDADFGEEFEALEAFDADEAVAEADLEDGGVMVAAAEVAEAAPAVEAVEPLEAEGLDGLEPLEDAFDELEPLAAELEAEVGEATLADEDPELAVVDADIGIDDDSEEINYGGNLLDSGRVPAVDVEPLPPVEGELSADSDGDLPLAEPLPASDSEEISAPDPLDSEQISAPDPLDSEEISAPEPLEDAADSSDEHGAADSSDEHEAADSSDEHDAADSSDEHGAADSSDEQDAADSSDEHDAADSSDEHDVADEDIAVGEALDLDELDSDDEMEIDPDPESGDDEDGEPGADAGPDEEMPAYQAPDISSIDEFMDSNPELEAEDGIAPPDLDLPTTGDDAGDAPPDGEEVALTQVLNLSDIMNEVEEVEPPPTDLEEMGAAQLLAHCKQLVNKGDYVKPSPELMARLTSFPEIPPELMLVRGHLHQRLDNQPAALEDYLTAKEHGTEDKVSSSVIDRHELDGLLDQVNQFIDAEPDRAANLLRGIVAERPGYAKAHCFLGRALIATGDRQAGLVEFRKADKLGMTVPELDELEYEVELETLEILRARDPRRLLVKLPPFLARWSSSSRGYELLALALRASGNRQSALEALRKARTLGDGSTDTDRLIYDVLVDLGKEEEAQEELDRHLSADNPHPFWLRVRFDQHFALKNHREALEALCDLALVADGDPVLCESLRHLIGCFPPSEGITVLRKVRSLHPEHVVLLQLQADLLMCNGAYGEALELYGTLLEADPSNKQALMRRSLCYQMQMPPEPDKALADLREAFP